MGILTIRNLDEGVKQKLRERAAARGISMEQEARGLLVENIGRSRREKSILEDLRRLGAKPDEPFDLKKLSDDMWNEGLQ